MLFGVALRIPVGSSQVLHNDFLRLEDPFEGSEYLHYVHMCCRVKGKTLKEEKTGVPEKQ